MRYDGKMQKLSGQQDAWFIRHFYLPSKRELLDVLVNYAENQQEVPVPTGLAYQLLRECTIRRDLDLGRKIQSLITCSILGSFSIYGDYLIRLFSSSSNLFEANRAFLKVSNPTHYTWNAVVDAHAKSSQGEMAHFLYERMKHNGLNPDMFMFLSILKWCSSAGAILQGRHIHEQILDSGLQSHVVIATTLIDMYAKCGSWEEARGVFVNLQDRNVVTWNAIIAGYAQHDQSHFALECFRNLQLQGLKPDKFTYPSIIKACGALCFIELGRCIHQQVVENELQLDPVIGSSLVDMYAKCESLEEACSIFSKSPNLNVAAWNAMISGYSEHGENLCAMQCFDNMQYEGIEHSKVTYLNILKANGSACALEHGRRIHEQIITSGLQFDIAIGSTLVDMYSKCWSLEEAHQIFNTLPNRTVVTWNAMISGYGQADKGLLALQCFANMQNEGMNLDELTYISILKACSSLGAIQQGKWIHMQIIESGLQCHIMVGSSLVDMYAKCGNSKESRDLFDTLPGRNVVTWSAMIAGYAQVGEVRLVAECFEDMVYAGIKPNDVVFTGILTAISHVGLVDEGLRYFKMMSESFSIRPCLSHVTSMIELVGHAGFFSELEYLIGAIKKPDICLWTSLLNACTMHFNVSLGRWCFDKIIQLDALYSPAYVLVSNSYANHQLTDNAHKVGSADNCARESFMG